MVFRILQGIGTHKFPRVPSFLASENILHARRDPCSAWNFYLMARLADLARRNPQVIEDNLARYGFRAEDTKLFSSPDTGITAVIASSPKEVILAVGCNSKIGTTHSLGFFGINDVPVPHSGMINVLRDFDKQHGLSTYLAGMQGNKQKRCWYTGDTFGGSLAALLLNHQPEKNNCFLAAIAPLTFGNKRFIELFNRKFEDHLYVLPTSLRDPSLSEMPHFDVNDPDRVGKCAESIASMIAERLLGIESPNSLYSKATPQELKRAVERHKSFVIDSVDRIIHAQTQIVVDDWKDTFEGLIPERQNFFAEATVVETVETVENVEKDISIGSIGLRA